MLSSLVSVITRFVLISPNPPYTSRQRDHSPPQRPWITSAITLQSGFGFKAMSLVVHRVHHYLLATVRRAPARRWSAGRQRGGEAVGRLFRRGGGEATGGLSSRRGATSRRAAQATTSTPPGDQHSCTSSMPDTIVRYICSKMFVALLLRQTPTGYLLQSSTVLYKRGSETSPTAKVESSTILY